MADNQQEKISFNIDSQKILKIIASEIYDTHFAVIRENIQNAYDAILMRFGKDDAAKYGKIVVNISSSFIEIRDNGIGMTFDDLQKHFWYAGSSGKHTEKALSAGVIGNFGIGALANFGVCEHISVETRSLANGEYIASELDLANLEINKNCVLVKSRIPEANNYEIGTKIRLKLQSQINFNLLDINSYINSFICFLPVEVIINNKLLSKNNYADTITGNEFTTSLTNIIKYNDKNCSFTLKLKYSKSFDICVICEGITINGKDVNGGIYLAQNKGPIMGYKSSFGLAPIPITGIYRFGGFANISTLEVTAGRDAITRQSLADMKALIESIEKCVSENIANNFLCDRNTAFIQWIANNRRIDLAKKLTIKSYPGNRDIKLADIVSDPHKIKLYYSGNNKDTIDRYNNENTLLLLPVKNTARGRIQIDFLKSINIESVKENPQVLKKFVADEYTGEEFMTLVTVRKILAEFYQLENCELYVADISHSVTFLPEYNNGLLEIFIQRNSEYFTIPKRYFEEARDIYDWLMNDFVRTKIYPSIQKYIPSAAQYGIEEMRKIYAKNKELYKYKYSESGNIEEIINNESLIKKILNNSLDQQTRLSINKLVEEVRAKDNSSDSTLPRLPIDRRKVYTDKKVLIAPQKMDILNNFTLFLGLSSKLLKHHYDFFLLPHTTSAYSLK